jgi:hypothetical protein
VSCGPLYGVTGEIVLETYHTTAAGADAVLAALDIGQPRAMVQLDATLDGADCRIGETVVLNIGEALDPTGRLSWALCQVWARDVSEGVVTLALRRLRTLAVSERP